MVTSDAEIDALIERLNELVVWDDVADNEPLGSKAARVLAALRDERDRLKSGNRYAQLEQQARARVRELEQKLERARVALEPFSQFAKGLTSVEHDTHYIGLQTNGQPDLLGIELRHFRRARAALAEIGQRG